MDVPTTIAPGGCPAARPDGRPIPVAAAECRALTCDRRGSHQCQRTGSFALREPNGRLTLPLCATHVRQLAAAGGFVFR
jgi:hypothetical protein